jgi:methyl-accepting chemotaxis protein
MNKSLLNNISIKSKLQFSYVILFVLFLIIGMTLLLGYRYVSIQASVANAFDRQTMNLQMILRGVNEVIVTEGTPASVEIVEKGLKGFDEIHSDLLSDIKNVELYKILNEVIDPEWKKIREGIKPFLEHHLDIENESLMIQYGKVITDTDNLIKEIELLSEKARTAINSKATQTRTIQNAIIFTLITILVGISLLLYHLYSCINSPIKELNNMAEGFESGDLSIILNGSNKDEFGILASRLNIGTANLRKMISNVKKVISILSSDSEELSGSAKQIANNAREQSSKTTQAASSIEELNCSFAEVAKNTVNVADSAKEAAGLAVKGGDVVAETIKGMNTISQSVNRSTHIIGALGTRSVQIGEIVNVINDVAEQTNLLALNAAIEAARAGEQGRGFSVVADEVRKLAEKTSTATNKIGEMIKGIQEDTNKAVETMETGTREVEEGVNLANQAGESLRLIVESVQNVTDMIQQIATATEEQSVTGEEITANLESVADITKQTADNVQSSSESTQNLNTLAQELQHLVNGFKLQVEAIKSNNEQYHAKSPLRPSPLS